MQDLGLTYRVMRGEGEFVGKDAYAEFKKLACVFYQGGAGILVHPATTSAISFSPTTGTVLFDIR